MILSDEELTNRIESPMNLLNRLKNETASHSKPRIISIPDSKEIIPDLDEKLQFGSAKSKAMNVMNSALDALAGKIPEIKAKELAAVAANMAKVIDSTQVKNQDSVRQAIVIINSPQLVSEDSFEVVDAQES